MDKYSRMIVHHALMRSDDGNTVSVEAEAEVPRAMAEAFRQGNLGVMDYYRLNNIKADTSMREAIAKDDNKDEKPRDGR